MGCGCFDMLQHGTQTTQQRLTQDIICLLESAKCHTHTHYITLHDSAAAHLHSCRPIVAATPSDCSIHTQPVQASRTGLNSKRNADGTYLGSAG